jgi:hypothetical protein
MPMINFLTSMVKTMPVTTFMMGLMLVTSSAAMVQPSLFLKLLLHPSSIWQEQQIFRLVTADCMQPAERWKAIYESPAMRAAGSTE